MSKEVILTGVRSNGELTLGNYLGAILPMVQLQQAKAGEYQLNFFVPDLHSFTTPIDNYRNLLEQTKLNLRTFAAAGFDFGNSDTYIYRQSYIPAHSELFAILNNFTYFGELSRMTQFKDKATISKLDADQKIQAAEKELGEFYNNLGEILQLNSEDDRADIADLIRPYIDTTIEKEAGDIINSSGGLFTYPVLMASDILLYGAHWVPVGDDQRQHLELTRDLAIRMNNKFGELFTVPHDWNKQLEFSHRDTGVRIRSLSDPNKKMSKSVEDPRGTILLTDTPAEAAKKVMSATTDSFGEIGFDFKERPGISNLIQMQALLTNQSLDAVISEWTGKTSYGDLKIAVAASVEQFLIDFQARLANIDDGGIENKLIESESAMEIVANEKLLQVQQAVGLRY